MLKMHVFLFFSLNNDIIFLMFCQGVKEEETVGKNVKLFSNIYVTDAFFNLLCCYCKCKCHKAN